MPGNGLHQIALDDRLHADAPAPAGDNEHAAGPAWRGLENPQGQMREVVRRIREVADTSLSVLIEGESGTGKELVSKAIHRLSARPRST